MLKWTSPDFDIDKTKNNHKSVSGANKAIVCRLIVL